MDAKLLSTPFPGCEQHVPRSDAYFECYIRQFTFAVYGASSSCRMGKSGSKDAVLDSELRVQGIKGLRVVDASVMPDVVISNPQATCMVIGEMGADMILKTWQK